MVDIGVVYDKLCDFETADDLAAYLKAHGIQGQPQNASSCAITNFVMLETGLDAVSTNTEYLTVYGNGGYLFNEKLTPAMADFVHGFDHGRYPELVEDVGWYNASE